MKALLLSTSPRKKSNTEKLAKLTLKKLEEKGVETEIYSIIGKDHNPCKGCNVCKTIGNCIINDDMKELYEKMKVADAIIVASPTYFYDVNSQCKIIIDRCYSILPLNGNKVGASIITAGSIGHLGAINTINMFFTVHGIANTGFLSIYNVEKELPKAEKSAKDLGEKLYNAMLLIKDSKTTPFAMHNFYSYGTNIY